MKEVMEFRSLGGSEAEAEEKVWASRAALSWLYTAEGCIMHQQLAMQPAMELGAKARGLAALQPPPQCLCSPLHGWEPVQGMHPALHTCSQTQPWDKPSVIYASFHPSCCILSPTVHREAPNCRVGYPDVGKKQLHSDANCCSEMFLTKFSRMPIFHHYCTEVWLSSQQNQRNTSL